MSMTSFKEFLKENDLKPVKVDLIAYSQSVYGLGSYLAMFTLNNGISPLIFSALVFHLFRKARCCLDSL